MNTPLVALTGNPNCGKTTLFNALTGANAKVGNYPGITVERREGRLLLGHDAVRLLDVPGTCSLSARTAEEQIAVSALAGLDGGEHPDAVLLVADATQLSRHLYLVLQVLELGLPVVLVLNMLDEVERADLAVDLDVLRQALGVPVVAVSAAQGRGLDEVRRALEKVLRDPAAATSARVDGAPSGALAEVIEHVGQALPGDWVAPHAARRDGLARWALLSVEPDDELAAVPAALREAAQAGRERLEAAGHDVDLELIAPRWAWIDELLARAMGDKRTVIRKVTDALDKLLIHPVIGLALFLLVMTLLFESLFTWASPAIDLVDGVVSSFGQLVGGWLPEGLFRDFLTDGLIAGVGAVLVFLPQIVLLFFFLSLLEDSGYMARAAYLMDRLMKSLGLTGRAFVPLLSGFACAIPAIMATRTMERRRDRLLVMMVVPLTTCSARLPVYTLIIAALFPGPDEAGGQLFAGLSLQSGLMVAFYVFGTVVALLAAGVFGRTILRGSSPPLVLELPPYRLPRWRSVFRTMWERSRLFVSEAGTVILVCTVVLWALLAFPQEAPVSPELQAERGAVQSELDTLSEAQVAQVGNTPDAPDGSARALPGTEVVSGLQEQLAVLDARAEGERLRASYAGQLGRAIEPLIQPLGFDWRIGIGLLGSFAAREVFVSTMGVVYGVGDEADETSGSLKNGLREARWPDGSKVFTPLVGLSLMVFFALAAQCMSTLAVVKRETASWGWPLFLMTYMTVFAWVGAFAVYQGGRFLGYG
ncbi:MAG: ferrous iron transport protein B [Planctomycetota bacterium]|nr:MAG: ferrous iron transport protein B [Planctomycetota bacterium]